MSKTAFTEGIEPGGLRTQGEIKLLICYIIKSANCALPDRVLTDVIGRYGFANFFETKDALADLARLNNIVVSYSAEGELLYSITPQGRVIAEDLEGTLPRSMRERAVSAALSVLNRGKLRQENRVEFHPLERGVQVDCHISDGESDMMCISLRLPDLLQAKLVQSRFQQDPLAFYHGMIGMLVGEKDILSQALRELPADSPSGEGE